MNVIALCDSDHSHTPVIYHIHIWYMNLQSLTKLLSHLEKNDLFVPPSPRANVALKRVADRDDTRDAATLCGTATLIGGEGENRGEEAENLGAAQQFCK